VIAARQQDGRLVEDAVAQTQVAVLDGLIETDVGFAVEIQIVGLFQRQQVSDADGGR
jgi:hypothetical protein